MSILHAKFVQEQLNIFGKLKTLERNYPLFLPVWLLITSKRKLWEIFIVREGRGNGARKQLGNGVASGGTHKNAMNILFVHYKATYEQACIGIVIIYK